MARPSRSERLFRALLRLFPAEFRGDFGDDMAQDFADQRRDAYRDRGAAGVWLVWGRTLVDLLKQAPREQAGVLAADVRYALRMLKRHAVSSAVLVLLLALGIGANAAVFGFADPLIRRPLPVPAGRELVRILAGSEGESGITSHAVYLDIVRRARAFSGVTAHQYSVVSFGTGGAARSLGGQVVSGTYFGVLGVRPALGRLLQPDDDAVVGAHPVVVISEGLWREEFGAAHDILGRVVHLNGHPFEIVGVAPRGFSGSYTAFQSRFWAPIAMYRHVRPRREQLQSRGWGWLSLTARLKPGVSRAAADADLARIAADLGREYPASDDELRLVSVRALGLPEGTQRTARTVLAFAATLAGLILIVACANIAGVLQARAVSRVRETSIRYALGASRLRVARQWLTESAVLALVGAAAGLAVARWIHTGLSVLFRAAAPQEPSALPLTGLRVLAFTVALALATSILFGVLPAWRSAARGAERLRESAPTTAGSRRGSTFEALRHQSLLLRRTLMLLANAFGALALLLAVVGIYGTMSHTVARRTREIGVRITFGATAGDVYRLIMGHGLVPVAGGVAAGLVMAGAVGKLVSRELFGVTPADPLTHGAAVAAVIAAAIAALALPARRATRVDPAVILRE